MVRQLEVSNSQKCCPRAEGMAGEGGFIRAQRLGPVRRSQNKGRGFPGSWNHRGRVCLGGGNRRLHRREAVTVKDLTGKEKEREISQPFHFSYSPIICHCLPLAKLTQKVLG